MFLRIILSILLLLNTSPVVALNRLSFDDLVELSKTEHPDEELQKRLDFVLYNPVVDNTIAPETIRIKKSPIIGDFIRIGSWNIGRGRNIKLIKAIFNDEEGLFEKFKKAENEINTLKHLDVLLISEADIGMPRTDYKNIPEELARTLGFNYAFGVEFVEVDPVHLGLEDYKWSEEKFLSPKKEYVVDKERYKGLHGNAVLSRFPIKDAKIIRLPDYYGWFNKEKEKIVPVEVIRRKTASLLFDEGVFREIRRGSRIALMVKLEIPGAKEPLTVIATHLENRTVPENRQKQLELLLKKIEPLNNPVVLAGDMNTTTSDGSPTSIKKEVRKKLTDPNFIGRQVINFFIPHVLIVSAGTFVTSFARKYSNPTVVSIPFFSPNKERKFFTTLEDFEFEDGGSFDYAGDMYRATKNKWGMLSDSNQRSLKGFEPTFLFNRPLFVGKFKLDWFFVKPSETGFAPFYGKTLNALNYVFGEPISDHSPITVDLPLKTPIEDQAEKKEKEFKKLLKIIKRSR